MFEFSEITESRKLEVKVHPGLYELCIAQLQTDFEETLSYSREPSLNSKQIENRSLSLSLARRPRSAFNNQNAVAVAAAATASLSILKIFSAMKRGPSLSLEILGRRASASTARRSISC